MFWDKETPILLGSQKLRKCGCAECLKEVSFAVGALLIKAADSWPLSCPRCCGRLAVRLKIHSMDSPLTSPLLLAQAREGEGQPAEGISSDSPRLAV